MNDVWFSEPVVIDFQPNGQRKVSSCFEAMECLDQRWPGQARDGAWRSASRVCRDALDDLRSPVEARKTLRKAAKVAGLALQFPMASSLGRHQARRGFPLPRRTWV